jgi:nucleoside diphosphate kinase
LLLDTTEGGGTTREKVEEIRASTSNLAALQNSTQPSATDSSSSSSKVAITRTFALIKPDAMSPGMIEAIMDQIRQHRFKVVDKKKVWLDESTIALLYPEHVEKPFYKSLITYFTSYFWFNYSGPSLALILERANAVQEWRELIGPTNSAQAKEEKPKS